MAIEQVKTINELERLPELLDSYAAAISTGSVTGSATLQQLTNYLKTYLESLANKVNTLENPSTTTYPTTQAVANESSRIISIIGNNLHIRRGNLVSINNGFVAPENGFIWSPSSGVDGYYEWAGKINNHREVVMKWRNINGPYSSGFMFISKGYSFDTTNFKESYFLPIYIIYEES